MPFKKTIICVWTIHYHPLHKPIIEIGLGLGDMIRGALGLFEYCREKKHDFILDIQLHPISTMLNVPPSPFADFVKQHKDEIKFLPHPDKIVEESTDDVHLIACNFCPYEEFSMEAKQFMLKVLTPKKCVSDMLELQLSMQKLNQYNILHLRCGDNEFLGKSNKWKRFVATKVALYNHEKNDVLLTDSVKLKHELKNRAGFNVFSNSAVHFAHEFNSETLLSTMLEFYAVTKAQKIKTYSRYAHLSGFVYFPSLLYGIPYEIMRMPWHIRILDIAYNLIALYTNNVFRLFKRFPIVSEA